MDNRIEELRKEGYEEVDEYLTYVKSTVADKSYFKDALDWYFFRYISPNCDRTYLVFGALLGALILFYLFEMYSGAYPLVQKVPIFINANENAEVFPYVYPLKIAVSKENSDKNFTADEIVAEYLVKKYVETRESYDFSKAEVSEVNDKFNQIRNTSSGDEYRTYQMFMSKDNPDSPIQNFGKNISRSIAIDSVRIIKKDTGNALDKAKEFIVAKVPTEAEVRFIATTKTIDNTGAQETKDIFFAKVAFDFPGIDRNKKDDIKFIVKSYRLFKLK